MCSTFPAHNGTFPAHSGTFSAHNGTFSAHIGTFPAHNVSPFLQNGKSRPAFKVKAGGPGCSGSACGLPSALQDRPPAPPARARRRYGREIERRSKPCGEPDDSGGGFGRKSAPMLPACVPPAETESFRCRKRKFSMSSAFDPHLLWAPMLPVSRLRWGASAVDLKFEFFKLASL